MNKETLTQLAIVHRNNKWEGALIVDGKLQQVLTSEDEADFVPALFAAFTQARAEGARITFEVRIMPPSGAAGA